MSSTRLECDLPYLPRTQRSVVQAISDSVAPVSRPRVDRPRARSCGTAVGTALLALLLSIPQLPATGWAAEHAKDEHGKGERAELKGIPESRNQIIRFTDSGIEPVELVMKQEDSIVFFLNSSSDALATIAVDFKDKTTHCASTNLKIGTNGVISSTKPIQPREFASICLHDTGSYPITIYGLKQNPAGIKGVIKVQ